MGVAIDFGPTLVQNISVYLRGAEMFISVSDAKGQLTDLVRRAEEGEDVLLTRHGKVVARIAVATGNRKPTPDEKRAILERIMKDAAGKATPGPDAARSQDFLYDDETGLPK